MKSLLALTLVILATSASYAQHAYRGYLAGSAQVSGITHETGFGLDIGVATADSSAFNWYCGGEFGAYGSKTAIDFEDYDIPHEDYHSVGWKPSSFENYIGMHGGVALLGEHLWLGVVALMSWQDSTYIVASNVTSLYYNHDSKSEMWFDVGPDAHGTLGHFMLEGAWSHRRGFKIGLGYIW